MVKYVRNEQDSFETVVVTYIWIEREIVNNFKAEDNLGAGSSQCTWKSRKNKIKTYRRKILLVTSMPGTHETG